MQDSTCLGRECVLSGRTGPLPSLPLGRCHRLCHRLRLHPLLGLFALGVVKAA